MDEILKELARLREENMRLLNGEDDEEEKKFFRKAGPNPPLWTATVYDGKGKVIVKRNSKGKPEEMQKKFRKASEADRWVSLRLTLDGEAGCYATVGHRDMRTLTTLKRDDAMSTVLGKQPGKPGQLQHSRPNPEHKPLGWTAKVSQTRVEFSRG